MSELTDDRLLPCPGCGRNVGAPHDDEGDGIYFVDCAHCGWRGPRAYNLTDAWNRWQRRAAASTSTEGAGVIEEAQAIAQRMRQIVQDVLDKREGYTDDQAWTDLHGQAMRLLEWDVRSRALTPPAPKVTTDEAEERE